MTIGMKDYAATMCNIFSNTGFMPINDEQYKGHVYRCTKQRYVDAPGRCLELYDVLSQEEFDELFEMVWPSLLAEWPLR